MRNDFRGKSSSSEGSALYDVEFDALLIEQSIATQYGILPKDQEELPYSEWAKLVSGLMENTPLGKVVETRGERDPKIIAGMNSWQKRIRADWQSFLAQKAAQQPKQDLMAQMAALEAMFANAFGGGGNA